jgi:hypothetical protein
MVTAPTVESDSERGEKRKFLTRLVLRCSGCRKKHKEKELETPVG